MSAGHGAPSVLGGYVLEDELGSGASSVVYAATHARLGRRAAVKVLVLPPRGPWRERFLRESQIAASIDHPNVIPVYDAGEDGGPDVHRDALRARPRPARAARA